MKTKFFFLLLIAGLTWSACSSRYLLPDRTQFIKDGSAVPSIDLRRYKSVQQRNHQDAGLAMAVSISGGGHRSANFAMGVLLGLEQVQLKNGRTALQEIDYLSTVSGGGFAAGAYIAALYDHHYFPKGQTATDFSLQWYFDQRIRASLKKSYAAVLAKANLNPRLWFSFVDDGDALEKAIDDHVCGYRLRDMPGRSIQLGDLFIDVHDDSTTVLFPMMIANGSLLDKWGVFPFTPDVLQQYMITGYTHRLKKRAIGDHGVYEMPLSVGIKTSGSFPVLISNTTLQSAYHPSRQYLHLVDGAMTDNLGYVSAISVLQQEQNVDRKVLLVIDADNVGNRPTFSNRQNAQFSIKVFGKLASSGLDARRINLEKDIQLIAQQLDMESLFFSFNYFIRNNSATVPERIDIEEASNRLIEQMNNGERLSDSERQELYELLCSISTKYTIKPLEQELLLLAGQVVVQEQETLLRNLLEANY